MFSTSASQRPASTSCFWSNTAPETEDLPFETVYSARHVRVYDEHNNYVEFPYSHPVQLVFQEPDSDICTPDGLLIIRPDATWVDEWPVVKPSE